MPAARNQEETGGRPLANSAPKRSRDRCGAERLSSMEAREENQTDTWAGKYDNGMAGSLVRDSRNKDHRVQGAGIRPPTDHVHYSSLCQYFIPYYDLFI